MTSAVSEFIFKSEGQHYLRRTMADGTVISGYIDIRPGDDYAVFFAPGGYDEHIKYRDIPVRDFDPIAEYWNSKAV